MKINSKLIKYLVFTIVCFWLATVIGGSDLKKEFHVFQVVSILFYLIGIRCLVVLVSLFFNKNKNETEKASIINVPSIYNNIFINYKNRLIILSVIGVLLLPSAYILTPLDNGAFVGIGFFIGLLLQFLGLHILIYVLRRTQSKSHQFILIGIITLFILDFTGILYTLKDFLFR